MPETPEPAALPRRPLVLLAEDDDALRELLAEVLRSGGLDVVVLRDGRQLSDWLQAAWDGRGLQDGETAPAVPDLVVTDIRMPGATGLQVAHGYASLLPKTVFLFMTAFPEAGTVTEAHLRFGAKVLSKPFGLRTFIDEVLALTLRAQ